MSTFHVPAESAQNESARMAYRLVCASHVELAELFETFAPVPLQELDGEYRKTLLAQASLKQSLMLSAFALRGENMCNGFSPLNERVGVGYNGFRSARGIRRGMIFGTEVGPSRITRGEAYFMRYAPYHSGRVVKTLVTEIRRAAPSVYLGLGRSSDRDGMLVPFLLEGPVAPFDASVIQNRVLHRG